MGFWLGFFVGIGVMLSIFIFGIIRFQRLTKNKTEQAMEILKNFKVPQQDFDKEKGTKEEGTKEE